MKKITYIYVIQSQLGHIKVGLSSTPETRLSAVRTHSPIPCRLIAQWQGTRDDEAEILMSMHACKGHGEWFQPCAAVEYFSNAVFGRGGNVTGYNERHDDGNARKESARRQSAIMKARWADPEFRQRYAMRRQGLMA